MGPEHTSPRSANQPEPRAHGWREILINAVSGHYGIDHSLERYFDYLERAK
ncbi:MAG: hypothetical protein AAF999_10410 [Pseudomonadota bacterium]